MTRIGASNAPSMPMSTKVSRKTLSPHSSCTSAEPGRRAREHVVNRGQFLEIEPHLRRDVLGLGPRRRDAHRDQLADLPHLAGRQDRLVRGFEALQARHSADRADALQVVRDEDAVAEVFGNVNRRDPGMSERAAHERYVLHVRQPDVGRRIGPCRAGSGRPPCAARMRRCLATFGARVQLGEPKYPSLRGSSRRFQGFTVGQLSESPRNVDASPSLRGALATKQPRGRMMRPLGCFAALAMTGNGDSSVAPAISVLHRAISGY